MNEDTKRWSIKPDWEKYDPDSKELTGKNAPYGIELGTLSLVRFADRLDDHLEFLEEKDFDLHEVRLSVSEMYDEWFNGYISESESLYESGSLQKELYEGLNKLTEQGYDVREYWRKFRDSMSKLWKLIPKFYEVERMSYDNDNFKYPEYLTQPNDYDPEKPFPQYPIPEDIEE